LRDVTAEELAFMSPNDEGQGQRVELNAMTAPERRGPSTESRGGEPLLAGTKTRFSFTDRLRPGFPDGLAFHPRSHQIPKYEIWIGHL
jgi:hypothetical protein